MVGCGGGNEAPASAPPARQTRVDWYGHQTFQLSSIYGTRVLTNPYADSTGGRSFPTGLRPSVVLVTHEKPDANNIDAFDNMPTVFRSSMAVGSNNANGIRFRGVATSESENAGETNVVFVWMQDGVRYCFLGNIQHALTSAQAAQIGPVDVLFMPSGSSSGLTDSARQSIIGLLHPRVIIPMGRPQEFGGWAGSMPVHRLQGSAVFLSRDTLPATPTVLVFEG